MFYICLFFACSFKSYIWKKVVLGSWLQKFLNCLSTSTHEPFLMMVGLKPFSSRALFRLINDAEQTNTKIRQKHRGSTWIIPQPISSSSTCHIIRACSWCINERVGAHPRRRDTPCKRVMIETYCEDDRGTLKGKSFNFNVKMIKLAMTLSDLMSSAEIETASLNIDVHHGTLTAQCGSLNKSSDPNNGGLLLADLSPLREEGLAQTGGASSFAA